MIPLKAKTRRGCVCLLLGFILTLGACLEGPYEPGHEPFTPVYPMIDRSPTWSPDGTTIAYYYSGATEVKPSGAYYFELDSVGIWHIEPDGTDRRMCLLNGDLPDWAPDGSRMALVVEAQIYTCNSNGNNLTQWTQSGRNFYPDWCPTGQMIAYDRTAPSDSAGIWILSLADSQKVRVAAGRSPDWSPDGSRIVYSSFDEQVWCADADGGNASKLTSRSGSFPRYRYPAWSPDGSRIAYSVLNPGEPFQIWVMNADGTSPMQLTTEGGEGPCWSPDGTQIVYSRYNPWEFCDENGRLWVMNSDGSGKRQLTSF